MEDLTISNLFVPYKESLELKKLGFNEPCFTYYKDDQLSDILELVKNSEMENVNNEIHNYISAPIFSQAFKFFREKYKLHSTITSISQESWQWHITKPGESLGKLYEEDFYNYEEAELACLRKLIGVVKENK